MTNETTTTRNGDGCVICVKPNQRGTEQDGNIQPAPVYNVHYEDHPVVAFGQHQFALFLSRNGERQLAIEKLEEVLRVYRESFGVNNPNVARRLNDLARAQRDVGETDAAKESMYKAQRIFGQVEENYGKATYRANVLHHSICLHILSALEFNSGNKEKGLELICNAGKLLVKNASKEGGDLASEEGRKLMIMETL
ncbi:MAG: tetratricopeptide repeat protein, partial [Candidatus Latescibacteria bacterium]|nr:tetratricopeptide repeat protein [Candidatus Latescibacterota bacterium]